MSVHLNRQTTFETFEARLVMSAQALTDFVAQFDVDQSGIDVDQQIETLSNGGGNSSYNNDIESIREQYNLSGDGQTIAVIDSGIAYGHEAFGGFGAGHKVVGGYDFAEDDANPHEDGPLGLHGTHVAGIIGGQSESYAGVAPGADLVSLRVFDDNGAGDLDWVEQALQWVHDNRNAFEHPITTVNLSIGTDWNSDSLPAVAQLEDEFAQLEADGIFISVAAGNRFQSYQTPGVSYPAASPFVVPVGSHDADGELSDFSQRSSDALFAPGEKVLSAVPDHIFYDGTTNGYLRSTGTSQAAPFAAGASALLREAFERSGVGDVDQDLLYDHFRETSDSVFDQVTGSYYSRINLERAIATALADDHGDSYSSATDLGELQGGEMISGNLSTVADRDYFKFTAQENGRVTLQVNSGDGFVPQISVWNEASQDGNVISFWGEAGQEYRFSVGSGSGVGNYQIEVGVETGPAEPVYVDSNGTLNVLGNAGDDSIQFQYGNRIQVSINGASYEFNRNDVEKVVIRGGAGNDQISATFDANIDSAILNGGRVAVAASDVNFKATGFETSELLATGSADRLIIRDTNGNDSFVAGIGNASAVGADYASTAAGFSQITIHASNGYDRVTMHGTNEAERFLSDNGRHVLRNANGRLTVTNMDLTTVFGGGGDDMAVARDSQFNDQFSLSGKQFNIQNEGYQLWGAGFERIIAESRIGADQIQFTGTAADDTLIHRSERTRVSNDQFLNVATNFGEIQADLHGGTDRARIFDSQWNDVFSFSGREAVFGNARQTIEIDGVEHITVIAENGGYDRATIYGTNGNDRLSANVVQTRLENSDGPVVNVRNFERVTANTLAGYDNTFLTGGNQRDLLRAFDNQLEFESTLQVLRIVNAESHTFDGQDGNDEVLLDGFGSVDLLEALGDQATAFLNSQEINVSDIEYLEARARSGEVANHELSAVDFLYLLDGQWEESD